jgi:hypothetical protein
MALAKTLNSGPPLNQRGQGAVEAILALPVFLAFVCLVFQLFFLGLAQIQLQYAAFYAARVGAVHGSDLNEMKRAVTRILGRSSGLLTMSRDHLEIEIIDSQEKSGDRTETSEPPAATPLKVRVHWHYPLIIPLADKFLDKNNLLPVSGRPSVHLQASWAMTMFGSIPEDENNANSPQP